MAYTTAQDFIYAALRRIGQLRPGYTANSDLLADALSEWTVMFDGYNAKRTMAYTQPDYVFPIIGPGHGTTGNGQSFGGTGYQIGPSAADFVVNPRPNVICRMNLYMTSASPTEPTRIPINMISMEEWMNIPVIQIPAINIATTAAYDPQWPNGVIWVWPPLNGNSLEIFTWGQLVPPASLGATYTAPPGYQDVVIWNLAERLWPLVTLDIVPHKLTLAYISGKADLARQAVQAINAPMPRLRCDFRGGSRSSASCDWEMLLVGTQGGLP